MRHTAAVFAITLGALTASAAAAQSASFAPIHVRTYYGCATGVSCHLVTVTWSQTAGGWAEGTVRAQSWFGNQWGAGYPMRLIVSSFMFPAWSFSDEYWTRFSTMEPYFDETFGLDASADGNFTQAWQPQWVQMQVSYGTPAGSNGYGPYGANIRLTATPEPASMLLLATGLGALGAGSLRRRRKLSKQAGEGGETGMTA